MEPHSLANARTMLKLSSITFLAGLAFSSVRRLLSGRTIFCCEGWSEEKFRKSGRTYPLPWVCERGSLFIAPLAPRIPRTFKGVYAPERLTRPSEVTGRGAQDSVRKVHPCCDREAGPASMGAGRRWRISSEATPPRKRNQNKR